MSQENVEKLQRSVEAYRRGDHATASEYLAEDVVWEVGQELPARGPAAVRDVWRRWESDWEEHDISPEEFIDAGDSVVVAIRYRGRGRVSGIAIDEVIYEVHAFAGGLCVRKTDHRERADALRAAGLEG
jgi:uncharacterized protein